MHSEWIPKVAKFRQNCHFCQIRRFRPIRQHFGVLLAGLIYLLLSVHQQPWRNFAKIATFADSPFSPTFQGPFSWVNLLTLIISPTTLEIGKISLKSPLSPNLPFSPLLWGPFNWFNLFALIISSTTLAKLRQNRHFCQLRHFHQFRQHFGALLAGLIYSLLLFRRKPWRNFAKNSTFVKFAVFAKFANISGPF